MEVKVLPRSERQCRLVLLYLDVSELEAKLRDRCAWILEFADPDDDYAAAAARLLEALDY